MKVKVIRIGNSKGLRLSKTILEKYDIQENVELILKDTHIELHPENSPRAGWSEIFKEEVHNDVEGLLLPDIFEDEILED